MISNITIRKCLLSATASHLTWPVSDQVHNQKYNNHIHLDERGLEFLKSLFPVFSVNLINSNQIKPEFNQFKPDQGSIILVNSNYKDVNTYDKINIHIFWT